MVPRDSLVDVFESLSQDPNPHRRGRLFERLVARLLRTGGFQVRENPGTARPRQTDLFARDSRETYLIETKWRKKKAGLPEVEELVSRLSHTDSLVVGVLISASGFASSAIDAVAATRSRPILLVTGGELEHLLDSPGQIGRMLRAKRDFLRVKGEVLLDWKPGLSPVTSDLGIESFLQELPQFLLPGNARQQWIVGHGGYDQFLFVEELPDIDWVPSLGRGVVTDLGLSVVEESDLVRLFDELATVDWVTASGRWAIQQAETTWYGIGAPALIGAITDWSKRYEHLPRVHHTERIYYQDVMPDGLYTLTVDVAADQSRVIWQADLSLQLVGAPLSSSSLSHLCEIWGDAQAMYFRSLPDEALKRTRIHDDPRGHGLAPVAMIVDSQEQRPIESEWVTGIVVRNPFHGGSPPGGEENADDTSFVWKSSELLLCSLRHYHPLSKKMDGYELWRCEWTWTSDVLALHVTADFE